MVPDHNIDIILSDFNDRLLKVINAHVPKKIKRVRRLNQPGWLSKDIKDCMQKRDWLKATGKFNDYKIMRNSIVEKIKIGKRNYFRHVIKASGGNSKKLWECMNNLTGRNTQKMPKMIMINKEPVTDVISMISCFSEYFAGIAEKLVHEQKWTVCNYTPSSRMMSYINSRLTGGTEFSIPVIKQEDVLRYLKDLDVRKATGLDELGSIFLCAGSSELSFAICNIINSSINSCIYPDEWKIAKVLPLYKGGHSLDVNNFRPISILSCLSKIMEKHVQLHLYKFLTGFNLLCDEQSGFRKGHSCQTSLTRLIDKCISAVDKGNIVGFITIDLRKAFDLLNIDILLKKLLSKCC